MLMRIARRELLDLWRDGRVRLAGGLVLTLLAAALLTGWQHARTLSTQREAAAAATRDSWLTQGEKGPHSAAHYGIYAFKPATPLSFVDTGVDPYLGVLTWLEAHRQSGFRYRPAQDQTSLARFGSWTAAAVLQLLVPLVIVMVAFGTFAGEREDGTLRQLLSLGIRPGTLLAGKALGITAALAVLVVPAVLFGVGALALGDADGGALAGSIPRLAILAAAYGAYFAIFLLLALAASARAPSARAALVVLIGVWAFNVLVAPRAAGDLARRLSPAPSALAFNLALEQDLAGNADGHDPMDVRLAALEQRLFREHNVTRREDLPVDFGGYALQEGERHGDLIFDEHYGRLRAATMGQERVHQAAGLAAPLLTVRALSMGLAGTDYAQHEAFAQAAEQYRRMLMETMNMDQARNGRTLLPAGTPYRADASLWASVPPFEYTAPDAAWVVCTHRVGLLALGAWVLGALLLAVFAIRTMPIDAEAAA